MSKYKLIKTYPGSLKLRTISKNEEGSKKIVEDAKDKN